MSNKTDRTRPISSKLFKMMNEIGFEKLQLPVYRNEQNHRGTFYHHFMINMILEEVEEEIFSNFQQKF